MPVVILMYIDTENYYKYGGLKRICGKATQQLVSFLFYSIDQFHYFSP